MTPLVRPRNPRNIMMIAFLLSCSHQRTKKLTSSSIPSSCTHLLHPPHLSPKMQVLLLGGHGKVALRLTPLLLNRAWHVTSVVRNPDHENEILALGKGRKGKLDVLISSLDQVKSAADAQKILDSVKPDYIVWSAGWFKHACSRTYARNTNNPQEPAAKAAPRLQSRSTKKQQSTSSAHPSPPLA